LLLLARAEELHDRAMLRMAHGTMGMTLFHMGEAKRAAAHFRSGLDLDDPAQPLAPMGIDVRVVHLCLQAWALWLLGYPDQALKTALDAVARAQALSHPHTTAFANGYIGTIRVLRGEFDEVLEVADSQHVLCSRYGLADFLAGAAGFRGTVMASRGQEEGIPLIEQWVASGDKTGLKMVRPRELCSLAQACTAFNQFDKASGALAEALTIAESDGDRYCEAETHRLRGELLMKQNESNGAQAQACFERAIEVARKQDARSWELRATTSLARVLRDSNRRDEARRMLAEIYNWFTEGFDTADLKEAKALLDELTA
jgi:predicted ATPase